MIINDLRMAWRQLGKGKVFSVITILGLAVGIATSLLLLSWIKHELSFDKFHHRQKDLYKVVTRYRYPGGEISHSTQTPMPLAGYLREHIPEVENATIYWRRPWQLKRGARQFMADAILTEQSFLDMFTFPFVSGSPEALLTDPRSVAISETLARKLFGDKNPLGEKIEEILYGAGLFTVRGVFADVPANSHMVFDILAPFDLGYGGYGQEFDPWDLSDFETYALLRKGTLQRDFDAKVKGVIRRHLPDSIEDLYSVQLGQIHLNPDIWSKKRGNITNVYIFSTVAFLIFLLAAINYINLTVARESGRRREVGIMKVVGAGRGSLFGKFILESMVYFLIATGLALGLAALFLPRFQQLTGTPVSIGLNQGVTQAMILGILLLTTLTAGVYPALHLSSVKALSMIKDRKEKYKERFSVRKMLVLFQFTVFIALIVGLIVIYQQTIFMIQRDTGFNREQVVRIQASAAIWKDWRTFRTELLKNPDIRSFTITNTIPGQNESTTNHWSWEGKADTEVSQLSIVGAYEGFLETFGVRMKQGRFFSPQFPSELREGVVINEQAAGTMGFEDPIGKYMQVGNDPERKVIGVIEDYHFNSLREKIGPLVLIYGWGLDNIFIRINPRDVRGVLSHVEGVFHRLAPQDDFVYSFLDQEVARLYTDEQRLVKVLGHFTLLAILISALGLYGLVLFSAARRTKEIGIRKVNGAGIYAIVSLLTRDSLRWVLWANIIAWPLGFWVIRRWLQNFAYRIDLTVWPFLAAGLGALGISLLVILYQTLKAARAHPVDSLRYE